MSIRIAFDSTTPEAIPRWAEMVWGYADGAFAWPATAWHRFPRASRVNICVTGDPRVGDMLDVERFDATPDHAPAWVKGRHDDGVENVALYASRDTWETLQPIMDRSGVRGFFKVVATLDRTIILPGIPPLEGPAAIQAFGAADLGIHADMAFVFDDGWHRQPNNSLLDVVYSRLQVEAAMSHQASLRLEEARSLLEHLHR